MSCVTSTLAVLYKPIKYFLRPEIKGALVLRIFLGDSNSGKRQCSLYILREKSGFNFFPELEGS
jgi:hypothetical protein